MNSVQALPRQTPNSQDHRWLRNCLNADHKEIPWSLIKSQLGCDPEICATENGSKGSLTKCTARASGGEVPFARLVRHIALIALGQ